MEGQRRLYESTLIDRGYVSQPRSDHYERQYQSQEYTNPQHPSQSVQYQKQPERSE